MFGVRRVRPCFDGDESLVADFTQTGHHSAPIDITVEKRNELPLTSARGQFEILEMDPPDASAKHEDPIFRITELQNIPCVKMHAHCVAVELIDKGTHIPGLTRNRFQTFSGVITRPARSASEITLRNAVVAVCQAS